MTTDTPAPPSTSMPAPQPVPATEEDWSDAAWELAAAQQTAAPAPPPAEEAAALAEAMREALAGETKTLSQEEIDRLLNFGARKAAGRR